MAKLSILAGSTSQTINVFVLDSSSTTGAGLTGLAFNTASLTAYYALPKAAAVSITLATLAAVTSAYSSGGFKEIDATNMPGWYRFDVPNAAVASGRFSSIHLKGATNMAPLTLEIELTGFDNQLANLPANVTQWSGSAVATPNVSGVPIADLGYLNGAGPVGSTNPVAADVTKWNGTAVSTPATAGIPDVNVKNVNNVSASSVTTVGANQGTTQPVNFTGTGASALVKGDTVDIAGTASAGAAGYVGIDWGHVNAPTTTVDLSGTTIAITQRVDVNSIKTQSVTCAGGVTVPAATLASTTNITAGVVTTATNVTTVNGLASGVITAASIASDADAEIAAAVWDLATSGHTTSGTFGAAMGAAGAAGDPWSTSLPASYGAGTAGNIVGNKLGTLAVNGSGHVTLADASLVTAKLGTFALAKTTNLTGFNDIAASAVVTGGAITTSGGAVSTVTTTTNLSTNNDKTGYALAATGANAVLVDGKTLPVAVAIVAAAAAGKISGAGTGTETFLGLDGSTTRAVVTVDSSGNRSAVSYP